MTEVQHSQICDLPKLANCHIAAFPDSLSSKQGCRFCRKMLEWYIISERGVLIHIVDNGKIAGYCSGIITKQSGLPGAVTSISQYAFREFVLAFLRKPWLLFHPENLKKRKTILNNIKLKLGLKKKKQAGNKDLSTTEQASYKTAWGLVGIGVLPDYQGKGYGSQLLQEFELMARADNVEKIQLTVKSENKKAINSYLKNGWEVANSNSDSLLMQKLFI